MRSIGFSTGALAYGQFRDALGMLEPYSVQAVELSALRETELRPLMAALADLDLRRFRYVSVHLPSKLGNTTEADLVAALAPCLERSIPVVLHPDVIRDFSLWKVFGDLLCIENMDKRKPTGRTAEELEPCFAALPGASFCLDVAHARQIDPTMAGAREMLRRFGPRLRQIHISELDAAGRHHGLSIATILATRRILPLLREDVPAIIESQVKADRIPAELRAVEEAFASAGAGSAEWGGADWGALA
jgi:hypothetical protein